MWLVAVLTLVIPPSDGSSAEYSEKTLLIVQLTSYKAFVDRRFAYNRGIVDLIPPGVKSVATLTNLLLRIPVTAQECSLKSKPHQTTSVSEQALSQSAKTSGAEYEAVGPEVQQVPLVCRDYKLVMSLYFSASPHRYSTNGRSVNLLKLAVRKDYKLLMSPYSSAILCYDLACGLTRASNNLVIQVDSCLQGYELAGQLVEVPS
ncbi:hypothetical protein FF38_11349 [Lucilia cuprina]|uniref:ZP domain-containing protein n=1 Tax=Lucilia cuprina TaxID=7375 RepID=A0A0L0CRR4_LUCCU|nr:hypothetical protein FF38_11349 [Lucilia cuprina]